MSATRKAAASECVFEAAEFKRNTLAPGLPERKGGCLLLTAVGAGQER